METRNVLDEIFFETLNSRSIEYFYFGVQYDENENFYLELECGFTQSYLSGTILYYLELSQTVPDYLGLSGTI